MDWSTCFWSPEDEASRVFNAMKPGVRFTVDVIHKYEVIKINESSAFVADSVRVRSLTTEDEFNYPFESVLIRVARGVRFEFDA